MAEKISTTSVRVHMKQTNNQRIKGRKKELRRLENGAGLRELIEIGA